jgi:hypothetical protein
MAVTYQVVALSSNDPDGADTRDDPELTYLDALKAAGELKEQGKAFRVHIRGEQSIERRQRFIDLGGLV